MSKGARLAALIFGLIALSPAASASASASATPQSVEAGAAITIVLHIPSPGPVEAAVMERVTCSIALAAGGTPAPCGPDQTATDARVLKGEITYAFLAQAPSAPGVYSAKLQRTSLLTVPARTDAAEVQFVVALATSNTTLVPANTTGLPNGTPNARSGAIAPQDANRFFASSSLAVVAIGAGVASRFSWRKP